MKISYGITVCDELTEIQELISFLLEHKRDEDEIVGMSYWTERRINQFIYGYMKFQFKKLFDAHSSVDTVKDVLNSIFK